MLYKQAYQARLSVAGAMHAFQRDTDNTLGLIKEKTVLLDSTDHGKDLRDIQETVDHIRGVIQRITRHNHQAPDSGVLDSRSPPLAALLTEMRRDRKARATQQHGDKGANRAAPKLGQMIQFLSKPPA